jgi:hypothetical protein
MSPDKTNIEVESSFTISVQDGSLSEAQAVKLLAKATAEATAEARKDGYEIVESRSGFDGGFLGIGETAAVLILIAKSATAAKIMAAAAAAGKVAAAKFGEGIAGATGGFFFERYLAPRLRESNLLPGSFHATEKKSSESKAEKKPAEPKAKKKTRESKRH